MRILLFTLLCFGFFLSSCQKENLNPIEDNLSTTSFEAESKEAGKRVDHLAVAYINHPFYCSATSPCTLSALPGRLSQITSCRAFPTCGYNSSFSSKPTETFSLFQITPQMTNPSTTFSKSQQNSRARQAYDLAMENRPTCSNGNKAPILTYNFFEDGYIFKVKVTYGCDCVDIIDPN